MIIIDWIRLGCPIEPAPGSHLQFFGLRPPSSVIVGDPKTDSHRVGGVLYMAGAIWEV